MKKENMRLKMQLERAEELIHLYRHDTLTGLKMRRDFEFRFTELFNCGVDFYLVLADVNGLHNLNREENYDAGDRLIKMVAHKFMEKSNGIVYRIGGDEFAALTLEEPKCNLKDESYVCGWVCSKNYKTEKGMFDAADRKIIKAKEEFYKSNGHDRRGHKEENEEDL